MSGKNIRTFVILSRNQILGGFDVEMLSTIFRGSIGRTFLIIHQSQPFLERFSEPNIFECFQKNRRVTISRTKS